MEDSPEIRADDTREVGNRPPLLIALAVLMFAEAGLVLALVVWELGELLSARPESYATAFALLGLGIIAVVWGMATGIGILRRQGWVRASAVTWQVLQLAVAVGCFQGFYARPDIGWALLIPAVAGILLAVSKPVVQATARQR